MPINTLGHPAPGSVPASPRQLQNPIHAKPSPGPGHTFGGAQSPSRETNAFPKQWDAPWCRGHRLHPRRVASSQVAGPSPATAVPPVQPHFRGIQPQNMRRERIPVALTATKGCEPHTPRPRSFSPWKRGLLVGPGGQPAELSHLFSVFRKICWALQAKGPNAPFPRGAAEGTPGCRGQSPAPQPRAVPAPSCSPRVDGRVLGPAPCGKRCCKGANKLKHGGGGPGHSISRR